jgi:peptidoglycan/xylan/chitin deacetylase (PgdA/CDA1 family)
VKNTAFIKTVAARTGLLGAAMKVKNSPPLILMYHGISSKNSLNGERAIGGKHIGVDMFVDQLRILRRSRRVVPLADLVRELGAGADMRNTVVLTFDDGYENNALVAAPVLADFNMTAAFFLTTGFIGTDRLIWTDQLEKAFADTQHVTLRLPDGGAEVSIRTVEDKQQTLMALKARIKRNEHHSVIGMVEKIASELGDHSGPAQGDYRFMSWDHARDLVSAGFEVGAHTINHPILTNLPFEEAVVEIKGSRDMIEQQTGQCSSTFCFPNGKAVDMNPRLVEFCRQHFKAALSTERGAASVTDLFALKRLSASGLQNSENMEWLLLRGH